MTWAAVVQAIRDRFEELVATPIELPVTYSNQPRRLQGNPGASGWARLTVIGGARAQVATGNADGRRFRTTGLVVINLFAPLDEGDLSQLQLIDSISDAFLGVQLDLDGPTYVHFSPPCPYGAATVDDAWWRQDVRIAFTADDFGGSEP